MLSTHTLFVFPQSRACMSNVTLVELAKRRLDFSVGPRKKKKVDSSELCREALRNLRVKRGGYKFGCEGKKIKLSEVGNPLDPRMSDGDKIPVSVNFLGSFFGFFWFDSLFDLSTFLFS